MVKRIVKMTFREESVPAFLKLFNHYRMHIRNAEGCSSLELLHSADQPSVLFTYSTWESEEHIERYRTSPLFREVWPLTRLLFEAPAEAWTVHVIHDL